MIAAVVIICVVVIDVVQAKDVLTCRECKDTQDPKSCSDVIVCGHGEECETREFVNHLGQKGFRMGCTSKNTCDLLRYAQIALGKRRSFKDLDSPVTTSTLCHECCDTQECNTDLCQSAATHITATPATLSGKPGVLTCRECKDAQDPKSCSDEIVCGRGEVCTTREFINSLGQKGFRMGCESKSTCDLLTFAHTAFGKRRSPDLTPTPDDGPTLCQECCESHNCNSNLCGSVVICTNQGCPWGFSRGLGDSCYHVGPGCAHWVSARKYCQGKGANMLVFNSEAEYNFWVKEFKEIDAEYVGDYWLGGVYSHSAGRWQWMEPSGEHYDVWKQDYSPPTDTHDSYALVHNPAYTRSSNTKAEMSYTSHYRVQLSFICERQIH